VKTLPSVCTRSHGHPSEPTADVPLSVPISRVPQDPAVKDYNYST